jgi:two-component system, LytTR family, response regulator
MRVLIIEDEYGVAQNLCDILQEIEPNIEILAILETIKDAVEWIKENPKPDLGFFDIRIADGSSFEIFERTSVDFPIIFTTAYDEFALKAFKVNSIDYLMKPIDKDSLISALNKYESIYKRDKVADNENLLKIIHELRLGDQKKYKKSFLVYIRDKIIPIAVDDIAYFYLEDEIVYCITHKNEKYTIDQALDKINTQINPEDFYRANRQFIVSRKAIKSAIAYFHRKLKLELNPTLLKEVLISKPKVSEFKKWLIWN